MVVEILKFWSKKICWCINGQISDSFSDFGPYALEKIILPLVFVFLFILFIFYVLIN